MRPVKSDTHMSDDKQELYWSVVGTLLYMVKHSQPDIANSVCKLSKVIKSGTKNHFKQMIHIVKYIENSKNMGIKLSMMGTEWELHGFIDSDLAGDHDNCKSVSGWVIFLASTLISCSSQGQKIVTLSCCVAEFFEF